MLGELWRSMAATTDEKDSPVALRVEAGAAEAEPWSAEALGELSEVRARTGSGDMTVSGAGRASDRVQRPPGEEELALVVVIDGRDGV